MNEIKKIKEENNPEKLIQFFLRISNSYFPSSIMLDKAKAIQLAECGDYTLDDAKNIIELILEIEPDYIPAYIEMGYFYDTVLDDPHAAVDIFNNGIRKVQQLLKELNLGKKQALNSITRCPEQKALQAD
jgi:hypothetical protein